MKVLVTGGAGFIGSHLTDALLAKGHAVHVLDNLYSGKKAQVPAAATFHELDILAPETAELIRTSGFDAIFHLAAQMDVRRSVAEPSYDAQQNILGSLNLLEAAVAGGVQHFLFASTGGACYGEQTQHPAPESHPLFPDSPYGIAKVAVEHYLRVFRNVHGLKWTALRFANVYGPRQNPKGEAGVVAIFAQRLLQGNPPVINGDGKQTRDYVHVADVVSGALAAFEHGLEGPYNIGTGVETDVNEVFHALNALAGATATEQHGPAKVGEQQRSVLDCTKLMQATGWKPQYNFRDGLAATFEWYRNEYLG